MSKVMPKNIKTLIPFDWKNLLTSKKIFKKKVFKEDSTIKVLIHIL